MKRFARKTFSVAALVALSGGAVALAQSQPAQLMSGIAVLDRTLDTKSAAQGQIVTARLTGSIQTPEGLKLPSGTQLIGHIDQVQASHEKSQAVLTLTFDKAQPRDGQGIPIKATLVEVDTPGTLTEIPGKINPSDSFDQQLSTSGEMLHSSAQASTSGTLTRNNKDIRLVSGTELLVGVAPLNANGGAASGS